MARIRTIKPDFWTDEKITECSCCARLLFIGLWNFADDNGNLQRSSKKIRMQVFPSDNFDIEPLVSELITHGLLIEYQVGGDNYLHIKNFRRHQVINRPSASSIPHCPLIEDSLSPHGGKGKEGNIYMRFDEFWEVYPKKRSRPDAEKAWGKFNCDDIADEVINSVIAFKSSPDWNKDGGQFIPYPATWLNRRGWEEPAYVKPAPRPVV